MKFLVIGCGSIGERHIKNLISLGIKNIEVYDVNSILVKRIKKKYKVTPLDSLQFNNPECTLICTSPNIHVNQAIRSIKQGSHVFIEKPISNSLKNINMLLELSNKKNLNVFVGYMFRFDKGITKIKQILSQNKIGKILSFDAYEGWYLPKWRPKQNYKKNYTVSAKQGGGIILDGSHELNYLQWLGGKINQVFSYHIKVPTLSKNTEGLAEILLKFNSNAIGRIHLDFINPQYNRHCEIIGDSGSIRWFFDKQTLEIQKSQDNKFRSIKYSKNFNEMYLNEMKYVIECINGKKNKILDLNESVRTLEISLAIKKSGRKNIPINV